MFLFIEIWPEDFIIDKILIVNFVAIDGMPFFLGFKEKANGVKASLLKSNQDQLS
jgi:hypothetical protein